MDYSKKMVTTINVEALARKLAPELVVDESFAVFNTRLNGKPAADWDAREQANVDENVKAIAIQAKRRADALRQKADGKTKTIKRDVEPDVAPYVKRPNPFK